MPKALELQNLSKKIKFEGVWGELEAKLLFAETTIHKIFETNSRFHVKQRTTGKVQFVFFSSFLLVLTKFSFWEEDWALGYNSMKFWDFPDISQKILSLKSFGNSWGNSYKLYLLLIVRLRFTCGESKICSTIKKSQNIMRMVVIEGENPFLHNVMQMVKM